MADRLPESRSARASRPRDYRPADYSQAFEENIDLIKGLVIKAGINPQDADDVASTIFLKFYEKDFLAEYDGAKEFAVASGKKTATFQGFLTGFVNKYVLQEKDKQATKARKEPIRCETPVGRAEDGAPELWIEVFGPKSNQPEYEIAEEKVDFIAEINRVHARLAAIPVRGSRDLARAFRLCVKQVSEVGHVDRRAIAREFKVSDTAIAYMFKDLRDALRKIGFSPEALDSSILT